MTPRARHWLGLCVSLAFGALLLAAHHALNVPEHSGVPVAGPLRHLVDPTAELRAEDVLAAELKPQWHVLAREGGNLGSRNAVHWLLADLPYLGGAGGWLEVANPLLDALDAYYVRDGQIVAHYQAGDRYPFAQRALEHRNFVFPLRTDGAVDQVLFRVQTSGATQVPLAIWPGGGLLEHDQPRLALQTFYAGVMAAVLVYCLFLFLAVGDRSYLYYMGFVVALTLLQLGIKGLNYQFLWPDAPRWNSVSVPIFAAATAAAGCFFTRSFLDLPRRQPVLAIILQITGVASLLMFAGTLMLPFQISMLVVNLLGMAGTIISILAALRLWRIDGMTARYFALAWALACLGSLVLMLNKVGLIERTPVTENAHQAAAVVAALLLSYVFAHRMEDERAARTSAQAEALEHERRASEAQREVLAVQEAANRELDQRVQARTHELQSALARLARANAVLQELGHVDGATGLKNRRFFDEKYRDEWRRAYRDGYPLGLVLLQVDGFAAMKERMGAGLAEDALRAIAQTIDAAVGRPSDLVARFSDEAIVILMPNTPSEGAEYMAEDVRARIAALELPGLPKPLTISAGAAAILPGERHHEAVLLSFADEALFEAVRSGGDRVVSYKLPTPGARSDSLA